jgi:hypothetical protein
VGFERLYLPQFTSVPKGEVTHQVCFYVQFPLIWGTSMPTQPSRPRLQQPQLPPRLTRRPRAAVRRRSGRRAAASRRPTPLLPAHRRSPCRPRRSPPAISTSTPAWAAPARSWGSTGTRVRTRGSLTWAGSHCDQLWSLLSRCKPWRTSRLSTKWWVSDLIGEPILGFQYDDG